MKQKGKLRKGRRCRSYGSVRGNTYIPNKDTHEDGTAGAILQACPKYQNLFAELENDLQQQLGLKVHVLKENKLYPSDTRIKQRQQVWSRAVQQI